LNYRLEEDREKVLKWINEGNMKKLQGIDQLSRERKRGNAFKGWIERIPTFRPTYRYERNIIENGYRVYSEEKMRVMSWCDRILYFIHPGYEIIQEDYNCCDQITSSDHSPVYSTFRIYTRLPPKAPKVFNPKYIPPFFVNNPVIRFKNVHVHFDSSKVKQLYFYIKFVASFLSQNKKSKSSIVKTTTPSWNLLEFPVYVIEKEYMQSQQVLCLVMYELIGPNISLGQGVLSLEKACDSLVPFKLMLYNHGLDIGHMTGHVEITGLVSVKSDLEKLSLPYE